MKYLLVFLVAFSAITQANAAGSEAASWKKANQFYQQRQYDSAAYYYEQVAAQHPRKAEVYYNLGNTYYRLNLVGPSVLNYEKALHLKPSFKEAEDNLTLTQARISNRIQPIPEIFFLQWWHKLTSGSKAGFWAFLSAAIFLSIIAILMGALLKKGPRVPVQATVGLAFLNVLILLLAVTSAANMADSGKAVVMKNDVPMYQAPSQGKATNLVPEGTTVDINDRKPGWVEVKLPDGRMGWMEQDMISAI